MSEFLDEDPTRPELDQQTRELLMLDFGGPEEDTRPIPIVTLAEISGRWRAQVALEEKQLRSVGSIDVTQPLPVGGCP